MFCWEALRVVHGAGRKAGSDEHEGKGRHGLCRSCRAFLKHPLVLYLPSLNTRKTRTRRTLRSAPAGGDVAILLVKRESATTSTWFMGWRIHCRSPAGRNRSTEAAREFEELRGETDDADGLERLERIGDGVGVARPLGNRLEDEAEGGDDDKQDDEVPDDRCCTMLSPSSTQRYS